MGKIAISPDGAEIKGTLETIQGCAALTFNDDGTWEYTGDTKIYWDTQMTMEQDGEPLFLCDGGYEHKLSDLRFTDEDDDSAEPVSVSLEELRTAAAK